MLDARDITSNAIYWAVVGKMDTLEYIEFVDSWIEALNNLNGGN